MDAVNDYAFINANLRGKLSHILSLDFLLECASSKDLPTFFSALKNSPFNYLCDIYHNTADIKSCEKGLRENELEIIKYIYKKSPLTIQPFMQAIIARYEIDNIKELSRLWFDQNIRGRSIDKVALYINKDVVLHPIPIDPILNAATPQEVVGLFAQTPYAHLFKTHFETSIEEKSLYFFETDLDNYYYGLLIDSLSTLNTLDKKIATRYVGTLIDIENLNRIVRLSYYFAFSKEQIVAQILLGGTILNQSGIKKISDMEPFDVVEILKVHYGKYLLDIKGIDQKRWLFAALLKIQEISFLLLEKQAFKALSCEPFSIGVIIAFIIKKTIELRRLSTLINAKYYNLSYQRIKELL